MSSEKIALKALRNAGYTPEEITKYTYIYEAEDGLKAIEKRDRQSDPIDAIDEKGAYLLAFMWADESHLARAGAAGGNAAVDAVNLNAAREAYMASNAAATCSSQRCGA